MIFERNTEHFLGCDIQKYQLVFFFTIRVSAGRKKLWKVYCQYLCMSTSLVDQFELLENSKRDKLNLAGT